MNKNHSPRIYTESDSMMQYARALLFDEPLFSRGSSENKLSSQESSLCAIPSPSLDIAFSDNTRKKPKDSHIKAKPAAETVELTCGLTLVWRRNGRSTHHS
jgi:hypothetical protein